jgi:uncharacterized protein YcfL
MKTILLLIPILALVGCKSTGLEYSKADGTKLRVKDTRLFTSTGASYEATVNTNGTYTIRAQVQSSPQAEAIGAVAEGVARGLKP